MESEELINAVEYVNQFFIDKAQNNSFLKELKQQTIDVDVKHFNNDWLGGHRQKEREQAVKNNYKWIETANLLGCHSIRVNAQDNGNNNEVAKATKERLPILTAFL